MWIWSKRTVSPYVQVVKTGEVTRECRMHVAATVLSPVHFVHLTACLCSLQQFIHKNCIKTIIMLCDICTVFSLLSWISTASDDTFMVSYRTLWSSPLRSGDGNVLMKDSDIDLRSELAYNNTV